MTNCVQSLAGKIVVMSGAAGILGSAAVQSLIEAGARVCALDWSEEALEKLGAESDCLIKIVTDVADRHSVEQAHMQLSKRWGEADVLFNNAATKSENFFAPFEDFPLNEWNMIMGVNLTGAMLCSQIFGKKMAERGSGTIINTLSIYGLVGPDQSIYEGSLYLGKEINTPAIYSASKAGLWGLTKYLATYWGHRGVRVNAITPGGVFSGQNKTFVENYSAKVPLGRMADRNEIVAAMLFLASDSSTYVNGHNLIVDGGWTAW